MTLPFTLDTIDQAAEAVHRQLTGHTVCALYGPMGAGKTTLAKALCQRLGVGDMVNSPTFALVNEYADANAQPIYHFDCYRLKNLAEALDMGIEDYLASGCLCLIEWPELVEPLLPPDTLTIHIDPLPDGTRQITL